MVFFILKNQPLNKLLHGSDWYDYRNIITKIHGHLWSPGHFCLFYRFTAYPAIPPAHLSFGLPRWLWCGAFQYRFRCLRLRLGFGFGLGRMAMGVSHKWRYPTSWMVYFMGNPIYKWMITGGTPILGNFHLFPWTADFEPYASQFLGLIRSASPWFAGVTNLEPTTWSDSG